MSHIPKHCKTTITFTYAELRVLADRMTGYLKNHNESSVFNKLHNAMYRIEKKGNHHEH